jgi:hypothetical protein
MRATSDERRATRTGDASFNVDNCGELKDAGDEDEMRDAR